MAAPIDRVGKTFGRLTVIADAGRKSGHPYWLCVCECGNQSIVQGNNLASGHTRSCGCRKGALTHGHAYNSGRSPEYQSWQSMKRRCLNPRHSTFDRYGGRGITVCARWMTFKNFLDDMGQRPRGTSLERRDNGGNYTPENCYWATRTEQLNNTCRTIRIEFQGQKDSLPNWARKLGIRRGTLTTRLKRGWSIERAMTEKVIPRASRV